MLNQNDEFIALITAIGCALGISAFALAIIWNEVASKMVKNSPDKLNNAQKALQRMQQNKNT